MMGLIKIVWCDHSEDDDHPRVSLLLSDSFLKNDVEWVLAIPLYGEFVNWLSFSVFLFPWLSWVYDKV